MSTEAGRTSAVKQEADELPVPTQPTSQAKPLNALHEQAAAAQPHITASSEPATAAQAQPHPQLLPYQPLQHNGSTHARYGVAAATGVSQQQQSGAGGGPSVTEGDGGTADSDASKKKVTTADIQLVQNLIERCLQLYMSQKEVVQALSKQAKIDVGFTDLVWQKLEEQNPEFFRSYYTRLKLKDQIIMFNHVLEQQVQMVQRLQRMYWMPQPMTNGAVPGAPHGPAAGPFPSLMRPGMPHMLPVQAQQPMGGAPGMMPYSMPHAMYVGSAPQYHGPGPASHAAAASIPASAAQADLTGGDAMQIDGTGDMSGGLDPLFAPFGSDGGVGPSAEGMPAFLPVSPDISFGGMAPMEAGVNANSMAATQNGQGLDAQGLDQTLDGALPKNFSFSDLHLDGDLMTGVQGDGAGPSSGLGMRRDFSLSDLAPLDMGDVHHNK